MNWAKNFVFYRSLELESNHWWLVRAKAKIGSKRIVQFMNFHLVVGIKPDVLLIYRIAEEEQLLILERIGSHSELFK